MLHLDVSKVDRVLRMLQCDPPTVAPTAAVEAPPWVTVRAPEAGKCLRSAHSRVG
jgi:hypothetical protein